MKCEVVINTGESKSEFIDSDFWSLDITLAFVIYPALKAFKEYSPGNRPASLEVDEWTTIIDKMIRAFELVIKSNEEILTREEDTEAAEGLELFGKYYRGLWT